VIFHNYHPFLGIEVAIKKVDQLIAPVAASANTSKGIKGIEVSDDAAYASASRKNSSKDHVDAINQMFAEFELAYHNQYHKAFPDEGALNLAKKYWLTSLAAFSPELVLAATRELVLNQPFLPSIASVVDTCKSGLSLFGLPVVHDAYLEACRMPSPKSVQSWSHPAVYMAGKATGWFELANRAEGQIFPLFEYHYSHLVQRALQGEELTLNAPTPIPESLATPLSTKENQSRLQELKASLKL
jgi:hypothetical protein